MEKEKEIKIYKISSKEKRHFIFFESLYIKTFGYIEDEQISFLKKDFTVIENNENDTILPRSTLFGKKEALNSSLKINTGWAYFNNHQVEKLKKVKNSKFIHHLLSDVPFVVFNKKAATDPRKIKTFTFSDFFFKKNDSFLPKRLSFVLSACESYDDALKIIFPNEDFDKKTHEIIKKNLIKNILKKSNDDLRVDFEYIKIMILLSNVFSGKELALAINDDSLIKKIKDSDLLYFATHISIRNGEYSFLTDYVNLFPSYKEKMTALKKFNIPPHISEEFSRFLKMIKEDGLKYKPDYDAMYFFNNIDRHYSRLKIKNYKLKSYSFCKDLEKNGYFVAKTYHDLIKIGTEFVNCIGNYQFEQLYSKMLVLTTEKYGEKVIISMRPKDDEDDSFSINQIEGIKRKEINPDLSMKITNEIFKIIK